MEHQLENKYLGLEEYFIKLVKFDTKDVASLENCLISEKHAIVTALMQILETCEGTELGLNDQQLKEKKIPTLVQAYDLKNGLLMIFDRYQEQSSLLDTLLQSLITPIMSFIQKFMHKHYPQFKDYANTTFELPVGVVFLLEILYSLTKVRGYKTIISLFPHEASDLEPCLALLHACQSKNDVTQWYCIYMLLLWMSIIVLTPFDLSTIDSSKDESIIKAILSSCWKCLKQMGKNKQAAALLIAKLLKRPDVAKTSVLKDQIESFSAELNVARTEVSSMHFVEGLLLGLIAIFKHGERKDLKKFVPYIIDTVFNSQIEIKKYVKDNGIYRKLMSSLAQTVGLVFLKPKVVSWRYQRGLRSLTDAFTHEESKNVESVPKPQKEQAQQDGGDDDDDDEDLEEEDFSYLEKIFDLLLNSLGDSQTLVRWKSGKGIGRLTSRLPVDFADEIVSQIIAILQDSANDIQQWSWHGACLALAELSRRGLLKPQKLGEVVPGLSKALLLDVNRGNYSVGAHVRDAACYVVWAFARAYSPQIMQPYVPILSTSLLGLSVFDREVNCRRAASAAFQENVGRQSNFPYGIQILTQADYFTLGNRTNAFLNVSTFLGQYEQYYSFLLDYLFRDKIRHWQIIIRQTAAQAMSMLSVFNPKLMINDYLQKLCKLSLHKMLNIRHGAILAVGEILMGISGNSWRIAKEQTETVLRSMSAKQRNIISDSEAHKAFKEKLYKLQRVDSIDLLSQSEQIRQNILKKVQFLIHDLENQKLNKGKGGEIMREAMCHFIYCASISHLPLNKEAIIQIQSSLQYNLQHPKIEVQKAATKAMREFSLTYHTSDNEIKSQILERVKNLLDPAVNSSIIETTRGYSMGIASLTKGILIEIKNQVINALKTNCVPKKKQNDDAETRREGVCGLAQVVVELGAENFDDKEVCEILTVLLEATKDYDVDKRGDVGSWVRQAAIGSIKKVLTVFLNEKNQQCKVQSKFILDFMQAGLKQLSEKIDKTRQCVGQNLQYFLREFGQEKKVHVEENKQFDSMKLVQSSLPEFDNLYQIFVNNPEIHKQMALVSDDVDVERVFILPWRNPSFTFDELTKLFDSRVYSSCIFEGIILSAGGLTESTLKASLSSLQNYLQSKLKVKDIDAMDYFFECMIKIFKKNADNDRVIVPQLKMLESLMQTGYLKEPSFVKYGKELREIIIQNLKGSKNIEKLMAASGLFSQLTIYPELMKPCLKSMILLLYHGFPKVRKCSSEKLYTLLITLDDEQSIALANGNEDDRDEALEILTDTNWTLKIAEIGKQKKERLLAIFGIQIEKK